MSKLFESPICHAATSPLGRAEDAPSRDGAGRGSRAIFRDDADLADFVGGLAALTKGARQPSSPGRACRTTPTSGRRSSITLGGPWRPCSACSPRPSIRRRPGAAREGRSGSYSCGHNLSFLGMGPP